MQDPPSQINLFGAKPEIHPIDRDLSRLSLTRREVTSLAQRGLPQILPQLRSESGTELEQWMFEVVSIRNVAKNGSSPI
jgi:hypothetical protein